jgi:hypothetical protein
VEQAKLTASDGAIGDEFGGSLSLSGDTALVGALYHNANGTNSGAAYVFVRNGTAWTEEAKLTASDGAAQDWFGAEVSLSGDTALVGAPGDDASGSDSGAAYVFVRSGATWSEQAKLTVRSGVSGFGWAVSVDGDTALVGGAIELESVYVFVRNGTTWTLQAELTAGDGLEGFGTSTSISGDRALAGAPFDDDNGSSSGSAYVFVRSGTSWTQEAKLTASNGAAFDHFGRSVSLSGDTALVGAKDSDGLEANSGSAYVFARSEASWTEEAQLTATSGGENLFFGHAVSLFQDRALVSAANEDTGYVFVRSATSWTEEAQLTASDDAFSFGDTVSLSGDTALVGAHFDNEKGHLSGSAYVFAPAPPPSVHCTAGISSSGCQAFLSASGCASASTSSGFVVTATAVEGQKDGLFFFGTNGQQANAWGNGTSHQCVVPPVVRTPTMTGIGSVGLCDGSFALDLNALWCPSCPKPAKNPGSAAVVQAQLWYRDPLSTSNQTTSLSDAIEFVVGP